MKFPLLNGQIDTDALADFIVTKMLVTIEVVVDYSVKRKLERDMKDVLDQIIDNS